MQQVLKSPPGPAGTEVVAAKLLNQFDVTMNEAPTSFHMSFGWE